MSKSQPCRECGTPVPKHAPFGHCPKCLVRLGFGPVPDELPADPQRHGRFGEYELLEQIGRGGMGIVYKARQTSLNRIVALKMLGSYAAAFPGIAERIQIEAEAAGSLRHPHIVTIHDVGEHEGRPFFSMEFIEGAGLDKFIGPEGFRPATDTGDKSSVRERQSAIVRVMGQIVRAVDYAHRRGVLHRDLKPANILIDANGEPHLTDFGLAKVLGRASASGTASGSILGTPAYMAPEQASGDSKNASTAADIYSLGAVLYEMLIGQPPFPAKTPLETLRCVVEEEPRHPSTFNRAVDRDLATVCLKCLEKDPHRRYSAASALAEDLDRWLAGEPIEARPVRPAERLWRWCRRKPVVAALVAGVGLLLVTAIVFGLVAYRLLAQERERLQLDVRRQGQALFNRFGGEFREPGRRSIVITAGEIRILAGDPTPAEGDSELVLGLNSARMDANILWGGVAPLAKALRASIAPLHMEFEFWIYLTISNAVEGFISGEVDVMQISPLAYLEIKRRGMAVTLLAKQLHQGNPCVRGAIFTHASSGIEDLAALKGRGFAFATADPAVSPHFVKRELFKAGLRASDLTAWTNARPRNLLQLFGDGSIAAGVARYGDVEALIKAGAPLKILREIRCPSQVWIAAAKANPDTVKAFQPSLLRLRGVDMQATIDLDLTGFAAAFPTDYDELDEVMEQSRLFDEPRTLEK